MSDIHAQHIAEVKAMNQEIEAMFQNNERLATLLERVANALKGTPEPDTAHSWHDLPELTQAVVSDAISLREALGNVTRAYIYIRDLGHLLNSPEQAKAAYYAGLAMGTHDALFRSFNHGTASEN
jgi:hypothetical protein